MDGVEVADGRETRDPRFDGIRLSDLVREVSVTVDGEIPKRRPLMQVNATNPSQRITSDGPKSIYWLDPRQDKISPYLLPLQIPHSVRFKSHDGRTVFYPDGLALGETVNITYPKPIQVRIELQGRADSGYDYALAGEVGTEAEGVYVSLHGQDLDEVSTSVAAEFPAPGIYRLKKAKKPKPASEPGGFVYQSVPQPTTATVEVRKGEVSTLRIDAPLAKE